MQYGIAKSILELINPALLKHLCLNFVRECGSLLMTRGTRPGDTAEDGRIRTQGVITGLLTTLTGRCTALRTLTSRRPGLSEDEDGWNAAAEEASYIEWAQFIESVRGTVESFTFEQIEVTQLLRLLDAAHPTRIMDETFQRIILPTLLASLGRSASIDHDRTPRVKMFERARWTGRADHETQNHPCCMYRFYGRRGLQKYSTASSLSC